MNNSPLESVVIEHGTKPQAAVIWLHGLGADGHDFAGIVPQLKLPAHLGIKFIFPHAPIQPVTINMGMPMRAWFDILGLHKDSRQDEKGIRQAASHITALIDQTIVAGFPSNKIVLAGFSQGSALALYTGLRYQQSLGGIIALSGFLPLAVTLAREKAVNNEQIPILLAHGVSDAVVHFSLGEMTLNYLQRFGYSIDWRTYPMQHEVCQQEIVDISNWLQQTLKTTS